MLWKRSRALSAALMSTIAATALVVADDKAETVVRDGFESAKTSWRREQTDASVTIEAHERSQRAAHEGRSSERFAFRAGGGSVLYYSLKVPKVVISDDARASVYVRADRPGAQLFGRVVLPADVDPETGQPSFLLVAGESVTAADRWQKLELSDLRAGLAREARVLRLGSNRRVSLEGAYLERLVMNLYGGAGESELFIDEMSVGPVAAEAPDEGAKEKDEPPAEINTRPDTEKTANPHPEEKDTARVRMVAGQILLNGVDWVPSIMDAPNADPTALRQAGFDAILIPRDAPARVAEEAVRAGLMVVPTLAVGPNVQPDSVIASTETYPFRDQVAFWNLGDNLGHTSDPKARKAELDRIRKVIIGIRGQPPGHPRMTVGTVADGLPLYALAGRNLDVMGIDVPDWGTIRDPLDTYTFLAQRRNLTAVKNAHAPFLAWIETTAPANASRNTWGQDAPPPWGKPQVQPEQIRMQAYAALAAGYRALGFRADSEITSESGQPRLMEMALLNAELEIVEPILARGAEPIQFWPTFEKDPDVLLIYNTNGAGAGQGSSRASPLTKPQKEVAPHPSIKCASIPTADGRGKLLLVADFAGGSQYQPPQMGVNDLKLLLPAADNAQAFEITPAGINVLNRERTTGGTRFTIPAFSGTAMVLVTTDHAIKSRLEAAVARTAPMASEFAIRQARAQLRETIEINAELVRGNHTVRNADDLLKQADDHLKSAVEARERMDYALAWFEARWAGRAIRFLRRWHFDKALAAMNKMTNDLARAEDPKYPYPWLAPIMCPPLTAFQTLPEAFRWMDAIKGGSRDFGDNLIPGGSFEDGGIAAMATAGWTDVGHATDGIATKVEIIEGSGFAKDSGKAALRLLVMPEGVTQKTVDKVAPFLDHPIAAVRTPPIPVVRDQLYRIRVLVRLNSQLPTATGGIIVRDSIGGEQYQFRAVDASPLWREVTLYRVAPEDGTMTVTLGLAGYSEAYFDRLRVDTISKPDASPERARPRPRDDEPIARRPAPPNPNPSSDATRPRR